MVDSAAVKALLRRLLIGLAVAVALLVTAFVVVVSIGIHVDLEPLRVPAQTLASTALDREVTLEGSMVLVPTWSPTVEIQGLHIGNPKGWPSREFARMDLARLTVGVVPILWGNAVIRELTAQGVSVVLERTADARVNWLLGLPDAEPETSGEDPVEEKPFVLKDLFIRSITVERLHLADIVVDHRDALSGQSGVFELADLDGTLGTHVPLDVRITGKLRDARYDVAVSGGPPTALLSGEEPWPLELVFDVADTNLTVKTRIEEPISLGEPAADESAAVPMLPAGRRFGQVDVSISGESLESLEPLVGVDLPRWGPHAFTGAFEAFEGGRYRAGIEVKVGTSTLEGTLEAVTGERPRIDVALASPTVQLDDFDTTGWSPLGEEPAPEEVAVGPGEGEAPEEPQRPAAILSPEVMNALDARLDVAVEEVVSGQDPLGQGRLTASLEGGRFRLDPFELQVPGGTATLFASLEPSGSGVAGEVRASVERFDYGILARRVDAATDMGGLFGLDVALKANAPNARRLMANANGHFDFAVFPENIDASLIDLWAVNLVAAVLPAVDSGEESRINCVVGLFDMEDGVMRQHTLMLDTTNMTVTGQAEIDFRAETVRVNLEPEAKEPEFFSVATPVHASGTFAEINEDPVQVVGVSAGDVVGTVVGFMTSIVHVPIRRIFSNRDEADDLDECLKAIARANPKE